MFFGCKKMFQNSYFSVRKLLGIYTNSSGANNVYIPINIIRRSLRNMKHIVIVAFLCVEAASGVNAGLLQPGCYF